MGTKEKYDGSQVEVVKCNYCGGDDANTIYDYSPLLIVQCKKCGLVYTSPRLKLSAIEERLYGQEFFNAYEADYDKNLPSIRKFYRRWLDTLAKNTGKEHWKICEIGPGLGGCLAEARECGHEVYGVELSEYAIDRAQKRFGIHTIYRGDVDSIDGLNLPQMDVFMMLASIEHLQDPLGALRKIHKGLSEGGLLLVGTGVWGSFNQIVAGKAWSIIAPEAHLYYFSKRTLHMLLEKAGFLPLTLETNDVLINSLTKNRLLVRLFNNPLTYGLGIHKLTKKWRLGDEMFSISKKVASSEI